MQPRSHKKAPCEDVEKELHLISGEEPVPSSSVDSEFQAEEEEYRVPNPVPVHVPAPIVNVNRRRRRACTNRENVRLWEVWEKEDQEWIDAHMAEDVDFDQQNHETAEPPSDLKMPLLRYQKEFLAWALKQEESVAGGGILADEMGMGKTIQAISLVLAKRKQSPGSTLVLCPPVALSQWSDEITRFTSPGSSKVLVYHGAKRDKHVEEFNNYDFVLTTYSTLENEWRFMIPPKIQCQYCNKSLHPKNLSNHYCRPWAQKPPKQSIATSKKKSFEEDELDSMDRNKSPLHSVKWNRIILDEAHYIKERRSNRARAVFALDATYRWALSGTPLQNRVGELYSLIRFLQIFPYGYYFCKDCDCKVLDYVAHEPCPSCPHNAGRHFCWWNKNVAKPIAAHGSQKRGERAMILLKHKVLKEILLRRTKLRRAADLALPPRIITLRRDSLDVKEAEYYESLYKNIQADFNMYNQAGTLLNNYVHIFGRLTRLRQAVNHPYLVVYSNSSGNNAHSPDHHECGICHDPAEDYIVTSCAHVFCKACLSPFSTSLGKVTCPTCFELLTVDWTTNADSEHQKKTTLKGFRASSIINRIKLDDFQTSTKIEALREEIRFMVERDGSAKAIVFSGFISFLDLINYTLGKSEVSCVQLVGSMSKAARDAAINQFKQDPNCRILLMSLKAGGVALNLTAASHVFMMDPCWNPAVERQAQDRIHRIGQYKPIRVVRFIIENTVEERILQLQQKKELVFEGTVGGSKEAMEKLTVEDMKFLFSTSPKTL